VALDARLAAARTLMAALEREAAAAGFTLLLLDGSPCDTVFFYKQLTESSSAASSAPRIS